MDGAPQPGGQPAIDRARLVQLNKEIGSAYKLEQELEMENPKL